ncbi:protein-L-isoaspartate(D-aspartate) O-methyltransferase [Parashewanella spongiae]|uniref:Protein-L-isoaspartate O-methyltransferase n=1 Tax=Parashewanella spongiae TaxID=342950 RepID=A0A3A6TUT7_9GAMM|nr:protein-L-isoaspartate(D-aspartate) O-methyltransferase [Parashewanella spongiae]MCL1077794.1 protein-L-isoaspartate(D-aspartate) O-methyltransferase [Parashewanella spongiae]RJY18028.1 protein-L-isoaspartate(D-aspartate) O-methyltransferase [Parashewanella spongiae]
MRKAVTAATTNLARKLTELGIQNPKVLQVVANTPREHFLDPALAHKAYENTALPIGSGQTISQPYIVARMTELILSNNPQNVLEIGTGSGYQTAILAQLVSKVSTVERIKSLQVQARQKMKWLDLHNISFKYGDGWKGWANKGPFDAILVTAAASTIPESLLLQLVDGGNLVIPVGNETQQLLQITRSGNSYQSKTVEVVRFVPLVNGELA